MTSLNPYSEKRNVLFQKLACGEEPHMLTTYQASER